MNQQRFPFTTLMVMDENGHGLPFAFVIHSRSDADTYIKILDAVRDELGHDVSPQYVMIDDDAAEISAVKKCAWGRGGTRVALCLWHAQRRCVHHLLFFCSHKRISCKDAIVQKARTVGKADMGEGVLLYDSLTSLMNAPVIFLLHC